MIITKYHPRQLHCSAEKCADRPKAVFGHGKFIIIYTAENPQAKNDEQPARDPHPRPLSSRDDQNRAHHNRLDVTSLHRNRNSGTGSSSNTNLARLTATRPPPAGFLRARVRWKRNLCAVFGQLPRSIQPSGDPGPGGCQRLFQGARKTPWVRRRSGMRRSRRSRSRRGSQSYRAAGRPAHPLVNRLTTPSEGLEFESESYCMDSMEVVGREAI
jgi:hypothetical protein